MYEQTYSTDWSTLTDEELLERAFALGVAAAFDETHPDELERLKAETNSAYDHSLIELAYDEGKTRSRTASNQPGVDFETVWNTFVIESEIEMAARQRRHHHEAGGRLDSEHEPFPTLLNIPAAISPIELFEPSDIDGRDLLRLPTFLD